MFERCKVLIARNPNGHRGGIKCEQVGGDAHRFWILLPSWGNETLTRSAMSGSCGRRARGADLTMLNGYVVVTFFCWRGWALDKAFRPISSSDVRPARLLIFNSFSRPANKRPLWTGRRLQSHFVSLRALVQSSGTQGDGQTGRKRGAWLGRMGKEIVFTSPSVIHFCGYRCKW